MKPIPENHTFSMRLRVTPAMTARFFDCEVHPLYATFALVEHAEYTARCVILPYLEPEEDAVGSAVTVEHIGPAPVGAVVEIAATLAEIDGRKIVCDFTTRNGSDTIAAGTTTQHIVSKEKMNTKVRELSS